MKIVSLFPAGSEIICNLGLSDNLVAVSHECDFPPLLNKKIRLTKSIIPKSIDQRMIDQLVKNAIENNVSIYEVDNKKLLEINPDIIRNALLAGYANSKILEVHGKRMIKSDYKPGFKLSLHNKDLKIAKSLLKSLGLKSRGLNEVKKVMNIAEKAGLSEMDSSVVHAILEKTYK